MDSVTRRALARNVGELMRIKDWRQPQLASHAGIAQTSVSNIVRPESGRSPTLANIEAVASALRVPAWMLLIPEIPSSLLGSRDLPKLIDSFLRLEKSGAEQVARVAEAEARYQVSRQ